MTRRRLVINNRAAMIHDAQSNARRKRTNVARFTLTGWVVLSAVTGVIMFVRSSTGLPTYPLLSLCAALLFAFFTAIALVDMWRIANDQETLTFDELVPLPDWCKPWLPPAFLIAGVVFGATAWK